MKELYLDANAHVPMSKKTIKTYSDYQSSRAAWGHTMAPSLPGREAAFVLEEARGKIASLLGAKHPNNIIFTNTCTQACEWGLNLLNPNINNIYHSGMEHSAVYQKLDLLKKYNLKKLTINDCVVSRTNNTLGHIVCSHVQNEIGLINDINNLKKNDNEILFSDMCQSPGKVPIDLKNMPIDIATFGAHKWGGPASVGVLYLKDYSLYKEFGTGSRYFNDRPGTIDVAAIIAASVALEETLTFMPENLKNSEIFQQTLEEELLNMNFEIIGKNANRVFNTTFVKMPNAFLMLANLSQKGIYVGMGSACGSMNTGPSLTMKTVGIEGEAHDFLRFSQCGNYGKKEALIVINEINKLLK